jgi:hypothetical protein
MIVKKTATFAAGEWAATLDGRADLEQYDSACRTLENFLGRPQGGLCKRPGMEFRGLLEAAATDAKVVEFERQGEASVVLAIAGGKMRFFVDGSPTQSGGGDYTINVPWADGSLSLLRWKQINDVLMFVHPDEAPRILTRNGSTSWDLSPFVPGKHAPLLPDNLDDSKRVKTSFKVNADWVTWSSGVAYAIGDRVKFSGSLYNCEYAHTSSSSNEPTDAATWHDDDEDEDRLIWTKSYADPSSTKGQTVTLTSNKALWTADHVGAYWEISSKRGTWDFDTTLAVSKTATGSTSVYSKVLVSQGKWTFQTFGNWAGKFAVERSFDRGKSWHTVRAFQSTRARPRNASAEGDEDKRVLLRIRFYAYSRNGTSGSPYAVLSVEDGYLRGVVKITGYTNSKSVTAITITPVEKCTTKVWAEGAWSDYQGYPRCIEFHQNRVVMAGTTRSPHTIWGSADDDYNNFRRGTLATDPWTHTVMIGQREPISWLLSDRQLVIGSAVGIFIMFGEDMDKPITPEDRAVARQNACGSHTLGPGVIPADAAALFVEHGGRVVRELAYSFQSDRYETGNLCLTAEHLFRDSTITDYAIQRYPLQVVWFVAGGQLFSLCYERNQKVAGWQRHPTAGTVLSIACIRKSAEDEVWLAMDHGTGAPTMERFHPGALTTPEDDGYWSDCASAMTSASSLVDHPLAGLEVVGWTAAGAVIGPAVLDAAFLASLTGTVIVGRPYTSVVQPMTPEIPLQNGTSRTREMRIHSAVVSVYRSRGGKMGETPDAPANKFDPLRVGDADELFTGEKEMPFDGRHNTAGNFCLVHSDPFPFWLRSVTLKFNVYGDDR